ncbi:4'-phosphopantetheinyl transferase family protein [Streptomyces marispadix]|uniref:4'-phosphopantetheinyl transferase superfamily protein n=1 Tax=Streptomyces marispadix TaxID=2922868 RepID=A0ABS9SX41_9ACTN|nr:4'-phosphopantetheinyl transferase superfamily protein [Streptomyces marispadix]MCH6160825.1 4'-phosphopantetheinyl transferase superfamily protein [Streptomyces marispadix]
MIGGLLPAQVRTEERFGNGDGSAFGGLFPEEAAVVAKAVVKRQREFADVRACARGALARLGVPPVPLVPGHRGAPRWPEGVVGSMTHCDGYRAAAVARAAEAAGVGIDAEPDGPLPEGVLEVVSLPGEREHLRALADVRPEVCWERLLFSAKESVFKVWYPLTSRELDFSEAEVVIDAAAGTFSARLLVEGPVVGGERLRGLTGRWAAERGLLVTAVFLGHGSQARTPL